MKLILRDRLAAWLLDAIQSEKGHCTLDALHSYVSLADDDGSATLPPPTTDELLRNGTDLFERAGEHIKIRDEFHNDLNAIRDRANHFRRALERMPRPTLIESARQGKPPSSDDIATLIRLAAPLFEEALYFEVHELLEPAWSRSAGSLRTFLQGIIQVAVGLHHHSEGNLRGAASLLADGSQKLLASPAAVEAYGLDRFCDASMKIADQAHRQVHTGTAAPLVCPPL